MQLKLLSSLSKVFIDEKPSCEEISEISMFLNERKSFQLAFYSEKANKEFSVKIDSSLNKVISINKVELIPSKLAAYEDHDDYVLRNGESGYYPDLLVPMSEGPFTAKKGWQSLWFELSPDKMVESGEYQVIIFFSDNISEQAKLKLKVVILDECLPKQTLRYTNWFHCDCLATYYKTEVFSERHWEIIENYLRTAVGHGLNFLLTPLFTPPLDTAIGGERPTVQLVDVSKTGHVYSFGFEKLKRWVDMCNRCGVEYFEMSHLFTQWGAEFAPKIMATVKGEYKQLFGWETKASSMAYKSFLTQFSKALLEFIDKESIREKCFFHVSDEPGMKNYFSYRRAAKIIKELFSGFRTIDALSDFNFYKKGLVETPIPAINHIEDFKGRVPELWGYYCCGQYKNNVPNRFFSMPSLRNEIIGYLLYKYEMKGFLQWGYNFWYSKHSISEIDPFITTDANEAFPSGDAFLVYPSKDGKPLESLRLKVFYDALQSVRALNLLESKIGREKTLAILEKGLPAPLSFTEYPKDVKWLLQKRAEINEAIVKN